MLTKTDRLKNLSPGVITFRKFKANTVAIIALGWIVFSLVLAVGGYLLTPDSSPFANTQHLEIAAQKPGSKIDFLRIRNSNPPEKQSFFTTMLWGKENTYTEIPVSSITIRNDSIFAYKYTGSGLVKGLEIGFHLSDILTEYKTGETISDQSKMQNKVEQTTISPEELEQHLKNELVITRTFYLGTDRFGRDLLSQLIIGSRVSLSVGFIAVLIALVVGTILGSLAGFFRGMTDNIILWFINVIWSIPTLLLVIAITFALGKGFIQIFVAVGITMWVDVARVVRGQIISLRESEHIEAARALGLPFRRIITRHLLPNITGPVVVISAANFASAILIEAGLSFLGIGVQPPMPSWGSMIRENYGFIILDKPFLAIIPGISIMLLVMAFMLTGNGLRDALDKTTREY